MSEDLGSQIRNAKVTADDLKTALLAVDDMEPEDRKDFTGRCLAIMSAFGLLGEPGSGTNEPFTDERFERINKVTATQIRIEALCSVANDPKFKAWSRNISNDENDYMLLHEDVLEAAAKTTLHESTNPEDKRSYFVPEEFFKNLLSISHAAGRG